MREQQKVQVAAAKVDAANRRNARSERRRGDGASTPTSDHAHQLTVWVDSPPPTPSLSPSKHIPTLVTSKSKADTPIPSSAPKSKAKPRSAPIRRGRLGRNQYTRDREDSDTPMRDASNDRDQSNTANGNAKGDGDSPKGTSKERRVNGESGRSSKAKTHPARTSMNEMKRRVAAILEFVGQLQTQRGVPGTGDSSGKVSGGETPVISAEAELPVAGLVKAVKEAMGQPEMEGKENESPKNDAGEGDEDASGNGNGSGSGSASGNTSNTNGSGANGIEKLVKLNLREDGEFRCMASQEMMETLTRELVGWQRVYGVYSR